MAWCMGFGLGIIVENWATVQYAAVMRLLSGYTTTGITPNYPPIRFSQHINFSLGMAQKLI